MDSKWCVGLCFVLLIAGAFGDFAFPNFKDSDKNQIQFISDADISQGNLVVTTSNPAKVGAAWYVQSTTAPVGQYILPGFKTQFTFVIDNISGIGGDGISFVVQDDSPYLQGTIGGGIGYGDYQNKNQGIPDSVAFEFDTLQDPDLNDPNNNHCGVHSRGPEPNSSNEDFVVQGLVNTTIPTIQVAGQEHTVVITYIARNTSLIVEYDGEIVLSSNSFNLSEVIDIDRSIGTCFVGLTSATTTTSWASHYLTSWYYWSGNATIDVPETIVYGDGLYGATLDEPANFFLQMVDVFGFNATASGAEQGVYPSCNITVAGQPNSGSADCVMTDNKDGTYTATYTMETLGSYDIYVMVTSPEVTNELVGDSPYNIFITGPPSAGQSTASGVGLFSATAGVPANFTITARDAIGTPITTGGANYFAYTTGPQSVNATIVDNNDGTYSASYTVTVSGTYQLYVMLKDSTGSNNIQDSPFSPTCVANVIVAGESYAYGMGTKQATAGLTATFFIQGVDAYGNNATTPTVNWDVSLEDDSDFTSGPSQAQNSPGLYTITYIIQDADDDYVLTVTDSSDNEIKNSPFNLVVVPGLPFAGECDVDNPPPVDVTTDTNLNIEIQAEDRYGNTIKVGGAVFTCSFVQSGGLASFNVNSTDNGDGTYDCSYSYQVPGTYQIDIDLVSGGVNTGAIEDSPLSQVVVGPAYGPSCSARGTGLTSAVAGVKATFQVLLYDQAGNPAVTGTDTCSATLSGPANPPVTCGWSGNSNVYDASYTATVAGTYNLAVNVNGDAISGSPFAPTVVAGAVSAGNIIAAGPGLKSADAGTPAQFNMTLYDRYGNPVVDNQNLSSNFSVTLSSSGTPTKKVTGSVSFSPSKDIYDATYTLTAPSGLWTMDVTFDGTPISGSPFTPTLYAGPIFAAECYEFPDPIPDATAYEQSMFQIQAQDQYGNPLTSGGSVFQNIFFINTNDNNANSLVEQRDVLATEYLNVTSVYSGANGIYNVPFTLNVTGNHTVDISLVETDVGDEPISNSHLYVFVQPAIPNPQYTYANPTNATAGIPETFTIVTKDKGGNVITRGGATFTFSMTMGNITVPVSYNDENNGYYSCNFTAYTAGQYSLAINMVDPTAGAIVDSPFPVWVVAGANCPQNATVFGDGLHNAEAGEVARFQIQSSDCYGNPILDSQNTYYDVLIEGPDCTFGNVTYVGAGLYNVSYVVNEPGNYTIVIKESGEEVNGSPFALTVTGEEASSSYSSSSLAFLITMIIFIILYAIVTILLIGYILWDKKKKIKKKFQKLTDDSD